MNGDDNHNLGTGVRRQVHLDRECTYSDFMKSKPLYFKGTEGLVELTQWFERMEIVFRINNCTVENQITFATCTLLGSALTGEIKKLEVEMWNLKVKSTDVTMQDAIEFATKLMDKKISTLAEHQTENKRKQDDNQQQENKRQNTSRAYIARPEEKNPYGGSKPLCSKCNYHHDSLCAPKYHKYNRVGHLARHYISDFPELKNQSHRNQAKGIGARRMVHALGGGETNQDLNDMEDDINA
nr:hypothetical protein [Tanacetum cinerariifolium]